MAMSERRLEINTVERVYELRQGKAIKLEKKHHTKRILINSEKKLRY